MLRLLRRGDGSGEPSVAPPLSRDPLRDLAERAAQGDRTAERTLLTALGPPVLRAVRAVLGVHHPEVPDACQDAALGLIKALPRFRGNCTVTHYACRIAVLSAMSVRRKACRVELDSAREPEECCDGAPSPASLAELERRRRVLRGLLDELPPSQAEALALHTMLGYTIKETALAMEAPVNTVRSHVRRGLAALRQRLREKAGLLELVGGHHD